jgi:regulator of cell morphogenesis and NO signaling
MMPRIHSGKNYEASSDYTIPADGCISYDLVYVNTLEQDLHQHIHLENNILFPRALEQECAVQPT